MKKLEEKEIDTRPFFYPMHVMPPEARKGINLPPGQNLTEEMIKQVVDAIKTIRP